MGQLSILIFGAGGAGKAFYDANQQRLNILAFVDNDKNKKGQFLCDKPIYHPDDLEFLSYDHIIIFSDYFVDIYQQLTQTYLIPKQKVSFSNPYTQEMSIYTPPAKTTKIDIKQKIAFFIHTADLFHHYGPVLKKLPSNSFDIITHGSDSEKNKVRKIAIENKYNTIDAEMIVISGEKYQAIISNHFMFPFIKKLSKHHIRFMYALGKANHNFAKWNENYDLILCFGPYQAQKMQAHSHATLFQMGYPRYDNYFNQPYDKEHIKTELRLDKTKKTIVWLPTWLELSSIDLFADKMSTLTPLYNVIVKCHPLSKSEEPQKIKKLENLPFSLVISEPYDNLKLFSIADFVFSDYGGTAFGALYLDKKLLLLNMPNPENDPLTGKESPDILLRKEITNVDIKQFHKVEEILNDTHQWESQKQARKKLRNKYFTPSYGFSADLAALAISNYLDIIETDT